MTEICTQIVGPRIIESPRSWPQPAAYHLTPRVVSLDQYMESRMIGRQPPEIERQPTCSEGKQVLLLEEDPSRIAAHTQNQYG